MFIYSILFGLHLSYIVLIQFIKLMIEYWIKCEIIKMLYIIKYLKLNYNFINIFSMYHIKKILNKKNKFYLS